MLRVALYSCRYTTFLDPRRYATRYYTDPQVCSKFAYIMKQRSSASSTPPLCHRTPSLTALLPPFGFLLPFAFSTAWTPIFALFFCASLSSFLRLTLASYLCCQIACLSAALSTGGRSSAAGPQGDTISVITCLIRVLSLRPASSIRMTSPRRMESFGSETR